MQKEKKEKKQKEKTKNLLATSVKLCHLYEQTH